MIRKENKKTKNKNLLRRSECGSYFPCVAVVLLSDNALCTSSFCGRNISYHCHYQAIKKKQNTKWWAKRCFSSTLNIYWNNGTILTPKHDQLPRLKVAQELCNLWSKNHNQKNSLKLDFSWKATWKILREMLKVIYFCSF